MSEKLSEEKGDIGPYTATEEMLKAENGDLRFVATITPTEDELAKLIDDDIAKASIKFDGKTHTVTLDFSGSVYIEQFLKELKQLSSFLLKKEGWRFDQH